MTCASSVFAADAIQSGLNWSQLTQIPIVRGSQLTRIPIVLETSSYREGSHGSQDIERP